MRIKVAHSFEIAHDAIELAFLSPALARSLGRRAADRITLTETEHRLEGGVLERTWSFRAHLPVPPFAAKWVTPDMFAWEERTRYALETHTGTWTVKPSGKPEWEAYFLGTGSYALARAKNETCSSLRRFEGDIDLRVPRLVKGIAERMIAGEIQRMFDAEAESLKEIATLV